MKIRQGFVSNSSSSSFIIKDKNNWETAKALLRGDEDYFVFKDVMYTSMIHNEDSRWTDFYKLAGSDDENYNEGDRLAPYGGDDYFVEVNGQRGNDSVWLPREQFSDADYLNFGMVPLNIAQKLYRYVTNYIDKVDKETFIEECKKIVNYEYEEE